MQFTTSIDRLHRQGQGLSRRSTRDTRVLWAIQGALALVFLFAGVSKLIMPADQLTEGSDLPVLFMRFIGCAETLGALGLVLPGIVGVQRRLTPVAAAGLVVIMVGAVALTITSMGVGPALVPFAVGAFAAAVLYGRRDEVARRS